MVDATDPRNATGLDDILRAEYLLVESGPERYGMYCFHARDASMFLHNCVVSVDYTYINFARFFSYVKKHHLLAVLSTLRLHKVQASMNLRHVLEGGAWAAYAIANPKWKEFVEDGPDGMIRPSTDKLTKRRNTWLDKHYPVASEYIKRQKKDINDHIAHAGVVYAQKNFKIEDGRDWLQLPFFDQEDTFHVRADLWLISAIGISLADLFYQVKRQVGAQITFADDFLDRLQALHAQHEILNHEMKNDTRFREIQTREAEYRAGLKSPPLPPLE